MLRSLMSDDKQRANFIKVDINNLLVDASAMDELATMGRVELPNVPNLDSTQLVGKPSLPKPKPVEDEDKL